MSSQTPSISDFPSLDGPLWANHAAIAPWPAATADAVCRFARENAADGALGFRGWVEADRTLRESVARFIGAPSHDGIAFLKNTTDGICTVANGIDWAAGDNVVTAADEFSSNRLPWLALADRGVSVRAVDVRAAADPERALLDAVDERTRVLTVSAVQWDDGLRLDLARLGEALRPRDTLFFVDAIQQLGALRLDVDACHIDALAADAHKWLLGPEGIAIFFCRAAWRERLALTQHGWHYGDQPYDFSEQRGPSTTARRFEAGSPNTTGQMALAASLDVLAGFGMARIEATVLSQTRALLDLLTDHPGADVLSRTESRFRSGIVTFRPTRASAGQLLRALRRRDVVAAVRGEGIRLSPHFYQAGTPFAELAHRLEEALEAAAKRD